MRAYQKILFLSLLVMVIPSMTMLYHYARETEREGDRLLENRLFRRYLAITSVLESIRDELLIEAIAAVNQNDYGDLYRFFDDVSLGHDVMDLDDDLRARLQRYIPIARLKIAEGRLLVEVKVPMFLEPRGELAYARLRSDLLQETFQGALHASDRERYALYRIEEGTPVLEATQFLDIYSRPVNKGMLEEDLLRRVLNERTHGYQKDVKVGLVTYNVICFPIIEGERVLGLFLLGIDREEVSGLVASMKRNIARTLSTGLFLAIVLTFLITQQLVRPVRKIEGFAQRVAGGDVEELLDMRRKDELGSLASHINAMVGKLRSHIQREGDYARTLEVQVAERTRELSASNERLQQEMIERKQAEDERETLQAQLAHSQKMESIGRLAGGVAHDFNNMLSVILGNTELALGDPDAPESVCGELREIRQAATRSADLVRQLLAFARRQTVAPRVFDLNGMIEGMLKMLRRLIGEDIELGWSPSGRSPCVKMDPTQLDQLLANLCVNARDAIRGVGCIGISTSVVCLDEDSDELHNECSPGEYVLLEVRDDGAGMDEETLQHLFEPFFTTKGTGEGTGLGLATVYGIARQNGGFVRVQSKLGQGTCFSVYLPRSVCEEAPRSDTKEPALPPAERGHETVLLVEDDKAVLDMTVSMLERLGHRVFAAATPGAAIDLARSCRATIHLLITDVIMPEMNGRDLAAALRRHFPGLRCLYMSGYTANVIARHGVLEQGVHFIQKPFSMESLKRQLQTVLHGDVDDEDGQAAGSS